MAPASSLFFQTQQAHAGITPSSTTEAGTFTVCHATYSYTANRSSSTNLSSGNEERVTRFEWQMLTEPQTNAPIIVHQTCNSIFMGNTDYSSLYSRLTIRNKLHLALDLLNEVTRPDNFPSVFLRDRFRDALITLYPLLNVFQRRQVMAVIRSKLNDLNNPFHNYIESLNTQLTALSPNRHIRLASSPQTR